jgi:internalin A
MRVPNESLLTWMNLVMVTIVEMLFAAAVSLFTPGHTPCGETEKKEAEKLESIGATLKKTEDGRARSIFLTRRDLKDEAIETVNFEVFTHVRFIAIHGVHITDRSFLRIGSLPNVEDISIKGTKLTDQGFILLFKQHKSLRSLSCERVPVSEKGLNTIGDATELRSLWISDMKINSSMRQIGRLDKLLSLDLPGTDLTDAGLAEIAGIKNLRFLRLDGTKVTDAGILQLSVMTNLRSLELRNTQVSEKGEKALQEFLPKLKIIR